MLLSQKLAKRFGASKELAQRVVIKLNGLPNKYLIILGHMRSGSTLLVHILASNPQIMGAGENYLKYSSPDALQDLSLKLGTFFDRWKIEQEYVMDKILHNTLDPDQSVLSMPNAYYLFLLREPSKTLLSLRGLNRRYEPFAYDTTSEEGCLEYYVSRLGRLEQLAKQLPDGKRGLFITYDQLINQTESTFAEMQEWLGLRNPLSKEYRLHSKTGDGVTGDLSENIKSGKIQKERDTKDSEIEPRILAEAQEAHRKCLETLSTHCRTPIDRPIANIGHL